MKRIILPTLLLTGALAAGTLGVTLTSAQDSSPSYPPIIQKLADRFNLNVEEVQGVFEEERAEHHAVMLSNFEDKLSEMVSAGKITEEQKQAILDKYEEMQAQMSALMDENLTNEERQEKMRAIHEKMRTWAEEQGIEFPFFAFKAFKHGGAGEAESL